MPNHVHTFVHITGTPDIIAEFNASHFTNGNFDFNSFIPRPYAISNTTSPNTAPQNATTEEIEEHALHVKSLMDKYGYDNWYDWAVANWGTKWNSYNCEIEDTAEDEILFNCQTAWSLPMPVFEVMAELYPELKINIETVEEGGWFAGNIIITNGVLTEDISKKQWKEYATRLLGWADEEEDNLREDATNAIGGLMQRKITDTTMTQAMARYVENNMDDFIKSII